MKKRMMMVLAAMLALLLTAGCGSTEADVLPRYPRLAARSPPLDVQAASYLAASVRMVSLSRTSMALSAGPMGVPPGRALDGVDDPEQLGGHKYDPYQNKKERPTSHYPFLLCSNLCSTHIVYRTTVLVKRKSNKDSISKTDGPSDAGEGRDGKKSGEK